MERAFLHVRARRLAARRRIGLALTLTMWTAFLLFDMSLVPGSTPPHREVFLLRALGTSMLAGAMALATGRRFASETFAERVITVAGSAVFLCLLRMATILDFPLSWTYDYVGLLAWMLGFVGLFSLRARRVAPVLSIWAVCAAAGLAIARIGPAPGAPATAADFPTAISQALSGYPYWAALIYLGVFALVGSLIAVQLERESRAAFLRERRLASANRALVQSRIENERASTAVLALQGALREAAESANAEKSRFLAAAAHDLGQLLHAVSLSIEAARLATGESARPAARAIDQAGRTLRSTREAFRRVLEISELESGLVTAKYEAFQAGALIAEVVQSVSALAASCGVDLRMTIDGDFPVFSDRGLLARVLLNLVVNAVRYADDGKRERIVTVSAKLDGNARLGRIAVADNGIGIPAERIDEAFRPFVRLAGPAGDAEGLGLGLSIVRAVIDMLRDHAIELNSTEGQGTVFTLMVPVAFPILSGGPGNGATW